MHSGLNSKLHRYLIQIDDFVPPLKFACVSSQDKKFRLADTLSRPHETQVINKNITPENEYDIQIRSSKLATTGEKGYTKPKLKILMDYILNLDDEQISLLKPGSIYMYR